MPEEKPIDVGDEEESAVEVDLPGESKEEASQPEIVEESSEKEEELEQYSQGVKGRIDQLTKRFREEERQKQSAIDFAENVRQENETLKSRLNNLDKGYQEEFGNRVTSQIDTAKRILKDAHETGDVDKLVEAQEALATLSVEKDKLNRAQKKPRRTQEKAPQPQAQPSAPPPDPRAEAWASKNEWFGKDEVMTYAAFGVHRRLIEDEGFDAQSEAYYSELDKRMLSEFPQKLGQSSQSNGGSKKVASAEASASRNRSGRKKSVRLTASQVAIAKRLNVPLEEYAKYVRD
jgi:hypothetical protein|tara:strand:- start:954 stop:1823 length:870 start_codon:yes stop_codon:yes gene_type:complete